MDCVSSYYYISHFLIKRQGSLSSHFSGGERRWETGDGRCSNFFLWNSLLYRMIILSLLSFLQIFLLSEN